MTDDAPSQTPGTQGSRAQAEQPHGRRATSGRRSSDDWDRTFGGARTAEEVDGSGGGFFRGLFAAIRELVIIVVLATLLSFVVKTWLIQAFWIPSGSMEDTLVKDDRVIVSKLTPAHIDLQRGDIVVFTDPGNWLAAAPQPTSHDGALMKTLKFVGIVPEDSDDHLIKRVIGLPGDKVACCTSDGRLTVNGVAITEPYVKAGDTPSGGRAPFSITVPAGKVWVMGDHRSDSSDSRFHDDGTGATGSVPIADITGRAVTIVWPLDRVSWLAAPESVFANVPAPGSSGSGGGTGGASSAPAATTSKK